MREIPIHWGALLVAAVAKMALGALWYSPTLFLKPWLALTGVSERQMKAGMAFVLVHAVRYAGATTPAQGLAVGFFNWLGFVVVATIGTVTYERKPPRLFLLNSGYWLVTLLVMGAILAVWG